MEALSIPPPEPTPDRQPGPLYAILEELGVTQVRLGTDLGVSARTIRKWCWGERFPREHAPALAAWLRAHGRDPADFSPLLEAPVADVFRLAPPDRPAPTPAPTEEEMDTAEILDPLALEHFKLPADPFEHPDDPTDIWMPASHRRIELMLGEIRKRRQMAALVADSGAGKSTLLRRVIARASAEKNVRVMLPASIARDQLDARALVAVMLRDLTGTDHTALSMEGRSRLLQATLGELARNGTIPVLLIDEAHRLPAGGLLAIKAVWDSGTLRSELAVILMGQLALKERLKQEAPLREVAGRTVVIEVPKITDAAEYLGWRFSRVNADVTKVFEPAALKALAARGRYPLWINILAMRAMTWAVDHDEPVVTAACVGRV